LRNLESEMKIFISLIVIAILSVGGAILIPSLKISQSNSNSSQTASDSDQDQKDGKIGENFDLKAEFAASSETPQALTQNNGVYGLHWAFPDSSLTDWKGWYKSSGSGT